MDEIQVHLHYKNGQQQFISESEIQVVTK